MKTIILTLCLWNLLYRYTDAQSADNVPLGPIESFIRTNLIGHPVILKPQTWEFDPDIALRRRKQFIELNGDKGEKLIERIGLGIDGRDQERLLRQRQRDEGHLGGLNYFLP
ncbi:uncharacterized protein LOC131840764 [Achroia grisella]|uniref:uncharacterized protein LOC131840764 n=1 Tax=Achroia grisella TaxID=688607 RepID=UPI0027D313FA|nr:uncharacterized protein LOC131840764 [Achroia grisella]